MVIEPRASVVVDGQEAVTLVPNRPGEHARIVHMHALSRLVVVASEMGMSMFMRVGLDLCSQAVGAFTVSGGHSGEVHFVLGSNAKGSKAEMAQFGMPSFPRVCSQLKFAAGSGVSHPPHWWLDSQPVCRSRFAQVVVVCPGCKCDLAFEIATSILDPGPNWTRPKFGPGPNLAQSQFGPNLAQFGQGPYRPLFGTGNFTVVSESRESR